MKTLQEIYQIAHKESVVVDRFALHKREALSIMDEEGNCYIAIDPEKISCEADERTKISHELGHCITGAFYNQYSTCDCRQRYENKADKWAILQLIPSECLDDAIANGCTEIWALAELFGVTEQFMRKAVCYYVHGNLATELYF